MRACGQTRHRRGTPGRDPGGGGPRAHAAHRQFEKSTRAGRRRGRPSRLRTTSACTRQKSSKSWSTWTIWFTRRFLDRPSSLEQLRTVWPRLLGELGDDDLAESREQYLRYALSIWTECVDAGAIRDPTRAIQVLDVLSLLFGEARIVRSTLRGLRSRLRGSAVTSRDTPTRGSDFRPYGVKIAGKTAEGPRAANLGHPVRIGLVASARE